MTEQHKAKLISYQVHLVQNMNPAEVINALLVKGVLTSRGVSEIRQAGERSRQSEVLLDYLQRASDHAFEDFCDALVQTQQDHFGESVTLPRTSL